MNTLFSVTPRLARLLGSKCREYLHHLQGMTDIPAYVHISEALRYAGLSYTAKTPERQCLQYCRAQRALVQGIRVACGLPARLHP